MLSIIIIQIGHVKIYRSLRRDTSLSSNYRSLRFQRINIFQFYLGEIVYKTTSTSPTVGLMPRVYRKVQRKWWLLTIQ